MSGKTPNYPAHDGLSPTDSRFVDLLSMPWDESIPGIKMKWIYKDDEKKESVCMFDASPGSMIPEHIHTGFEQTYILEGSMVDDDGECIAGNFVWRPTGSRHTARFPKGCKYLVFFRGSAQRVDTGRLFPSYE